MYMYIYKKVNTEEKTNVVVAGDELHQDDLKKRNKSILFFKSS